MFVFTTENGIRHTSLPEARISGFLNSWWIQHWDTTWGEFHWIRSTHWILSNHTSGFWHHIFIQKHRELSLWVSPTWYISTQLLMWVSISTSHHHSLITLPTRLWYYCWAVRGVSLNWINILSLEKPRKWLLTPYFYPKS
jgi:hypothetical protein